MSSGVFQIARYEDDDLVVRSIVVQPETIGTDNPEAVGTIGGDRVRVSGGQRKLGRKARTVTLKRQIGAEIEGIFAEKRTTIPILTFATWDAITDGQAFTYNGNTWTVAFKTKESGKTGRS